MKEKKTQKERTLNMISKDDNVARWLRNLNAKSTKDTYSTALFRFYEFTGLNPEQLIEKFRAEPLEAENQLMDFIHDLKGRFTPKSVHNNLVGIKSWLRHNGVQVSRKINVGNTRLTPTIANERPPSQDELRQILNYADIRGKSAIALIAFAGLRPSTAVAIKLSDIPELRIEKERIIFTKMPALIKIRANLSKNSRPYFTFLCSEGCEYLTNYLNLRVKQGENLGPDSPVISHSLKAQINSFSRKGFNKLIKRIFQRAGFPHRPYVLRSYFDTAILNSRGIPHELQQFWMGHSGSIEATYTVNKALPEWQIEENRETFREYVEPRLSTIYVEDQELKKRVGDLTKELEEERIKRSEMENKIQQLREITDSGEKYDSMVINRLQRQVEELSKRLDSTQNETSTSNNNNEKFIVVNEEELVKYLNEGYNIVKELTNRKIIVSKPISSNNA
jgi:integrase